MQTVSKDKRPYWIVVTLMMFFIKGGVASVNPYDSPIMHPPIPLLDEKGDHVLNSGQPMSSKMSCGTGGCHDYDSITHAYHFEMGRDEASDDFGKKRGLPQFVSPGYFGGYSCMGGSRPNILSKKFNARVEDFMDYGAAGFIKDCGNCHAGGGFGELDRTGVRYDQKNEADIPFLDGDYYERMSNIGGGHGHGGGDGVDHTEHLVRWDWKKSGVVENDCMMCHADFKALKKFPASGPLGATDGNDGSSTVWDFYYRGRSDRLMGFDFFRESATMIWEFYDIKPDSPEGMQVVSFERTFEEGKEGDSRGYTFNLDENGKPIMHWNSEAFDENGKILIPMLRFPANDNCMQCHRTSNSRRGFYGFGDNAVMEFDDDGVIEPDYQDDVHKGKLFTADNGEVRSIENCNTCHSRNYLNPPFVNVDLDVNHNFLKGNSDMDVRNDLDFDPNAASCEHCHDEMINNVVPSGQATMLDAHRELWKANGDMFGYDKENLTKITKTHLDVVSCQGCHITGKKSRGNPIQIMYRYRQAKDGDYKIFPYTPKMRYYWKNKNGDEVLTRIEKQGVFEVKSDADGNQYAAIVDPISQQELGQVTYTMGRHGASFGEPEDYETFVALKKAYDNMMKVQGAQNPDMQLHWIESNQYIMSHNVRPSSSSVPCADCHTRKQNGSFSSLVSAEGIFGNAVVKTVVELPDKRLIDEGIVVLDVPYYEVNDDGVVTQNVENILYETKIDSFMTWMKASNGSVHEAEFKRTTLTEAMEEIDMVDDTVRQSIEASAGDSPVYLLNTHQGDPVLKSTSIVGFAGGIADLLLPNYRVEAIVFNDIPDWVTGILEDFVPGGKVASSIHYFAVTDANRAPVPDFFNKIYVKLPYRGKAANVSQVRVVWSENGSQLNLVDQADVVLMNPHSEQSDGYVIFAIDHLNHFAIMDVL